MAEFSKQYCEVWDNGFPYDFDIEKVAKNLEKGNYYPIICEGFGFHAIGKDDNGNTLLGFKDNEDGVIWQDYNNFMASQYKLLKDDLEKQNDDRVF